MDVTTIFLQLSLLLFGASLCVYTLSQQRIVGIITLVAHGIGLFYYLVVVVLYTLYKKAPFQATLSGMTKLLARRGITTLFAIPCSLYHLSAASLRRLSVYHFSSGPCHSGLLPPCNI